MKLLVILRDSENKIQKLKENEVKDFYYGFNFLQNSFNEKILYLIRSKPNTFIKYIFYPFEKIFSKFTTLGFHIDILFENFKIIKNYKKIFTPTDGLSFAILFGKLVRLHKAECFTLFQSLSERKDKFFRKNFILIFIISSLLNKAELIYVLSEISKQKLLEQFKLKNNKVVVFRFGIDYQYWSKNNLNSLKLNLPKDFILTVGNDMNRDFEIFNKIKTKVPIVLVSQKKFKNLKNTIILHNISNTELKYLYHKSLFVVIPIKKLVSEASGLSTIMQSMCSGKLTIIPNNNALLEYFQNKHDVAFYESEDANSLQKQINFYFENNLEVTKIGKTASSKIEKQYNLKNMESQNKNYIKI